MPDYPDSNLMNRAESPLIIPNRRNHHYPIDADVADQLFKLPLALPENRHGFQFLQEPLADLSEDDQLRFRIFGQGPVVQLPFTAVHHAFEAQAAMRPSTVAAEHLGESITYGELNHQANRLAAQLAAHGVTAGDNISLFVKRSIPMLVGLMAALKIGAAYVPQDVGVVPETQLRHIIKVTDSKVVLTLSKFKHLVPAGDEHVVIAIDDIMQQPVESSDSKLIGERYIPDRSLKAADRCFILFTSGTTGKPERGSGHPWQRLQHLAHRAGESRHAPRLSRRANFEYLV